MAENWYNEEMEEKQTVIETSLTCPFCSAQIDPKDYFCPNCGKKIREKPVGLGFWAMVSLFGLSTLAPPLNLPLTIRYLKSPDEKVRTAGWISLVVSIISFGVLTWLGVVWAQSVNRQMNESLKQYQNLGL